MPGVQDWINRPLDITQGYFDPSDSRWIEKVNNFFEGKLQNREASCLVPSVNHRSLHQLKPNSLVRYRGMVQDMYDPEFYLGVYEVEDSVTGAKALKPGRYQDVASCSANQKINVESKQNVTMDRQTYYCVPVPGENSWAKQIYAESEEIQCSPGSSRTAVREKRALDSDESNQSKSSSIPISTGDTNVMESSESTEQTNTSQQRVQSMSAALNPIDLNFPLPGEKGPACLVKVYEDKDTLKLNDMVEVIGIFSVDPSLAVFPENTSNGGHPDLVNPGDMMDGIEEQAAHSPPPSLVPRIHVIRTTKLQHVNPLLPPSLTTADTAVSDILQEASRIRDQLRWLLQQLLLGDDLTADYLLLHLLSNVYARRDVSALGKWSLNISGCPNVAGYTRLIYEVIQQLVTKSHMLSLTLGNLNTTRLSPKKDYTANRLKTGVLQLSERTHVVLDETVMESGQLDTNDVLNVTALGNAVSWQKADCDFDFPLSEEESSPRKDGVLSVTALGNAISWQKVDYDFDFHKTEFPTNLKFLILSEGKSMLPSDCHVRLQKKEDLDLDKLTATVQDVMTSGNVNLRQLRCYITVLENLDYDLTEDMQKIVEQDFVDVRKDNRDNMTQQDLHNLLIMARLMSVSSGETKLTVSVWERVKRMETARKARLRAADSTAGQN